MSGNDPMDLDAAEVDALMGKLSEISNRTNQMTLDALLRAVPSHEHGYSGAAAPRCTCMGPCGPGAPDA